MKKKVMIMLIHMELVPWASYLKCLFYPFSLFDKAHKHNIGDNLWGTDRARVSFPECAEAIFNWTEMNWTKCILSSSRETALGVSVQDLSVYFCWFEID